MKPWGEVGFVSPETSVQRWWLKSRQPHEFREVNVPADGLKECPCSGSWGRWRSSGGAVTREAAPPAGRHVLQTRGGSLGGCRGWGGL